MPVFEHYQLRIFLTIDLDSWEQTTVLPVEKMMQLIESRPETHIYDLAGLFPLPQPGCARRNPLESTYLLDLPVDSSVALSMA
jgi:hypothetical protein